MVEITFSSDAPHFSQEHLIFGQHYILEFEWIERESYWVLHLYGDREEAIALGLRVTPNWPIFVDKTTKVTFLLLAMTQSPSLTLASLHRDFRLIAYEVV